VGHAALATDVRSRRAPRASRPTRLLSALRSATALRTAERSAAARLRATWLRCSYSDMVKLSFSEVEVGAGNQATRWGRLNTDGGQPSASAASAAPTERRWPGGRMEDD